MTPEERKAEEGKKPGEKVATMTQTRKWANQHDLEERNGLRVEEVGKLA